MSIAAQHCDPVPYEYLDDSRGASPDGPVVVFAHAVGLPPGCYRSMLAPLARRHAVYAPLHRALWFPTPEAPSGPFEGCKPFGRDTLTFLEHTLGAAGPVVAVGHSMGAAALLHAAHERPERFAALVLIEPPVSTPLAVMGARWMKQWAWKHTGRVKRLLAEPDQWPDRHAVWEDWRAKYGYRRVCDQVLGDIVDACIEPGVVGVHRRYPRDWEAAICGFAPDVWPALRSLPTDLPVLALRGEESSALGGAAWRRWGRERPDHTLDTLPALGHVAPFESPDILAAHIEGWLADVLTH